MRGSGPPRIPTVNWDKAGAHTVVEFCPAMKSQKEGHLGRDLTSEALSSNPAPRSPALPCCKDQKRFWVKKRCSNLSQAMQTRISISVRQRVVWAQALGHGVGRAAHLQREHTWSGGHTWREVLNSRLPTLTGREARQTGIPKLHWGLVSWRFPQPRADPPGVLLPVPQLPPIHTHFPSLSSQGRTESGASVRRPH